MDNEQPQIDVIVKVKCARCGHAWYPAKPGRPVACARCKRRNWWVAMMRHAYPFRHLEVGQSCTIAHDGTRPTNALAMYEKRTGRLHASKATSAGLIITRTM